MSSENLDYFIRVKNSNIERLETKLEKFSNNGFPVMVDHFLDSNNCSVYNIGISQFLIDRNISNFKEMMYNTTKITELKLKYYMKNNIEEVDKSWNVRSISTSILTNNFEFTKDYCNMVYDDGKFTFIDPNSFNHKALILIVLNRDADALTELYKRGTAKLHFSTEAYYEFLMGLATHSQEGVTKGLQLLLKSHKKTREYKNTIDEFIAISLSAMIKLAIWKGFEVNIQDALIPNELINDNIPVDTTFDFVKEFESRI